MGNPVYQTYAAGVVGAQTPVALNNYQTPFNASFQVWLVSTGTYGVQYTIDDINGTLPVRWTDDANAPTGTTVIKTGNYMFPIRALRINIAANATGIEFKVIQGLPSN
jgi:hypothetical protein